MQQPTDSVTPGTMATPDQFVQRGRAWFNQRREVKRFTKFAIVGAIGFLIDFSTTNILWSVLGPTGVEVPLPFGLASLTYIGIGSAIGFVAAVSSNFLWNRYWTYPDSRSKSVFSQLFLFFGINVVGLFIRTPILEYGSRPFAALFEAVLPAQILSLAPELALRLGKNAALMVAVVVVMFWNFFINRYVTYNDVK